MKVVIVARTRMTAARVCIGAVNFENDTQYRLLTATADNQPPNTEFRIADIWDISGRFSEELIAPHTEDFIVTESRKTGKVDNLARFIRNNFRIITSGPAALFNGYLAASENGSGYISRRRGQIPEFSTQFWISNYALTLDKSTLENKGKCYYKYPRIISESDRNTIRKIKYVGFQEPIQTITAGTLLRASLARWWTPGASEVKNMCFLQLSGWFDG